MVSGTLCIDQYDINESTRVQLDAISTALAELQAKPAASKSRRPIGFIQPKDDDNPRGHFCVPAEFYNLYPLTHDTRGSHCCGPFVRLLDKPRLTE